MLMAALRLNIPAVFVSGGPMEAGKVKLHGKVQAIDLIDAMVAAADDSDSAEEVQVMERSACPTCGSCSGMFTANSMNCLTEALGLALPGNGTVLATHADRKRLFVEAGHLIVDLARRYYEQDDASVLPRSVASLRAFENAMTLDIAMGGSTNTVLHLLAAAHEAKVDFTMRDIDRLSRRVPVLCKVAPSVPNVHLEDVHRAGGIMAILGELGRAGLIDTSVGSVHSASLGEALGALGRAPEPQRSSAVVLPGGARRRSDHRRLQSGPAFRRARPRSPRRRHSRGGPRLQPGRRSCRALREPGGGRLHPENGRRRHRHSHLRGAGAGVRKPGCGGRRHSGRTRSRPATWS